MSSLFGRSIALLGQTAQRAAGVTVKYRRGIHEVEVDAVPGFTEFQTEGPDGVIETFQTRDWLIFAKDLVIESVETLPQHHDEIVENGMSYRVLHLEGIGAFRFSDPYRTILRIHTKHIE